MGKYLHRANFHIFFREVRSPSGGLCGLGALLAALQDTIFTPSQLTTQTYESMREVIFMEMKLTPDQSEDAVLLKKFYKCN